MINFYATIVYILTVLSWQLVLCRGSWTFSVVFAILSLYGKMDVFV